MKTMRMEQLGMIPLFGEPEFQLKRLQVLREDDFDQWENCEKALYYQTARRLIEKRLEETDRHEEHERFRELLRNRYETFLAQSLVEERPGHLVNALFTLSQIAEHEEGEGEGKKYLLQTLPWIGKLKEDDQDYFSDRLVDFFEDDLDALLMIHEQTVGTWADDKMLKLSFQTVDALAEDGWIDDSDFCKMADEVESHLRERSAGEFALRLTSHLVQLVKRKKATPETKEHFWRKAFEAANDFNEPYTKMLMGVLLADRMKTQENWHAANFFLQHVETVAQTYGEQTVYGGNFDQIKEAIEEVRDAVQTHGYYESLS